jgi:signal transduction histidine kinase
MKHSAKVFFSIGGVAVLASSAVCVAVHWIYSTSEISNFRRTYETQLKLVSSTLHQLESIADRLAFSAARTLRELDRSDPLPTNEQLKSLASDLGVAHIFVTDSKGIFIRSTNGAPETIKSTLFDYCEDYKQLLTGTKTAEHTPIIPSADEEVPGPFKYTMIPNFDRTRILEVSVPLSFIQETLGSALKSDPNILSLTLFSPTGVRLGHISADRESAYSTTAVDFPALVRTPEHWEKEKVTLTRTVAASIANCCECKTKGIAGADNLYHYYLAAEISSKTLNDRLRTLKLTMLFVFATVAGLSGVVASRLTRILGSRLGTIRNHLANMGLSADLSARLEMKGSDEFAHLANQIDQMTANLADSQKRLLESEKTLVLTRTAEALAHDIRSPLAALNLAVTSSSSISGEERHLIQQAALRIREISARLLERSRLAQGHCNALGLTRVTLSQAGSLQTLFRELVREKRILVQGKVKITFEFHSTPDAEAGILQMSADELKRLTSNVVDNSIEAEGVSSIAVRISNERNRLVANILDDGNGVPADLIEKVGSKGFSHGKPDGTGLGLYLAKEVLRIHSGHFEFVSSEGSGTRVTFVIPKTKPDDTQSLRAAELRAES